jgi:AcrR family transcriptional regulator
MPKQTNQRERIVKTALKLFADRGYASTPVSLIARKAKVSQGLMYNFFKSKDELLMEIMSRGFEDIKRSMQPYTGKIKPRDAIAAHVRQTFLIIDKHKEFWRLLHTIRLQGEVAKAMRITFGEIVRQVTRTFRDVFAQLGFRKPDLEAMLFLSQIDGLVILYLQDPATPIKQLSEQLIHRYAK